MLKGKKGKITNWKSWISVCVRRQKRNRKWRTKTFLVDDKSAVMQCIIITFYARLPWILIDRLTFINVNWLTNCRSSKHNKEIEIDWHDTIKKNEEKNKFIFSAIYVIYIKTTFKPITHNGMHSHLLHFRFFAWFFVLKNSQKKGFNLYHLCNAYDVLRVSWSSHLMWLFSCFGAVTD